MTRTDTSSQRGTNDILRALSDRLVRVHREDPMDSLDGYVVGHGKKWLLLAVVDDNGSLDGYSLVRASDLTDAEERGLTTRFVRKSLELEGRWPPVAPSWIPSLDSISEPVAALIDRVPVIGLYIETEDPDVLFVGAPFAHKPRSLGLREIDASGTWQEGASEWAYKRISRVDFGNRYVSRMLEVAQAQIGA